MWIARACEMLVPLRRGAERRLWVIAWDNASPFRPNSVRLGVYSDALTPD
jgi:hypothetical protein